MFPRAWTFRSNCAPRLLVGPAPADIPRSRHIHRLLHLGRVPGRSLPLRALSFALLFARDFRPHRRRSWFGANPAAGCPVFVTARHAHPVGSRRIPLHLLLLSRRILQSVLGRSALLRRRRAAQANISANASFPLIIQNIHRYFLYIALHLPRLLAHDVWKALWFRRHRHGHFGDRRRHAGARS